jgi:hypothetical protein
MFCFANLVVIYFAYRKSINFRSFSQLRSYTVGKIKYVANKKLHGWQHKACCKEEVTRLAKQTML